MEFQARHGVEATCWSALRLANPTRRVRPLVSLDEGRRRIHEWVRDGWPGRVCSGPCQTFRPSDHPPVLRAVPGGPHLPAVRATHAEASTPRDPWHAGPPGHPPQPTPSATDAPHHAHSQASTESRHPPTSSAHTPIPLRKLIHRRRIPPRLIATNKSLQILFSDKSDRHEGLLSLSVPCRIHPSGVGHAALDESCVVCAARGAAASSFDSHG
jgi:hypothetical protein